LEVYTSFRREGALINSKRLQILVLIKKSAFDHVLIMDDGGQTRYADLSLTLRKHGELDDVRTGIGRLNNGTCIYNVKWDLGRQGTTL